MRWYKHTKVGETRERTFKGEHVKDKVWDKNNKSSNSEIILWNFWLIIIADALGSDWSSLDLKVFWGFLSYRCCRALVKNFNLLKPERGPSEFLFATCRKHVCLLWLLETRNSRPSLLRSGSQVYFSLREFHVKYPQLILQKRVCVCARSELECRRNVWRMFNDYKDAVMK